MAFASPSEAGRPPQPVRDDLWVFAPNRDSQGGTAWWLALPDGGVLIDCPGWSEANLAFLRERPAGQILLTSREGHGRCRRFQEALGWPVLVQEQEAYLLPGVERLETFAEEAEPRGGLRLLWTPGPTPGASVVLAVEAGGLFCGRLLVPTGVNRGAPLRSARTFHWPRQWRSLARLRQWLPPGAPDWIASGAALGALRGEKLITGGRRLLEDLVDRPAVAAAAAASLTGGEGSKGEP
ncbi:MBL fold metallo-hydrolase [Cyanobium sp. Morenito 9A2]|uniref:MBL fold metallo-hydrolase n=1 Tax=Cyanobium sp. Morenito 9A2 TaxID=2823718 RepID=UPI0020CD295B|nr:MBL fold metallo-hydrolase [Cyanobium sp. Morenito 9A2]MCP9848844.1 MBL fold metallo-hydrolase [Cyanobium sp. Morenito 9A2]